MLRATLKLAKSHLLMLDSRATYIRGYWPEPITQSTLAKFLEDINYFQEPKKFIDIGIEQPQKTKQSEPTRINSEVTTDLDLIFEKLGQDVQVSELDYDVVICYGKEVFELAKNAGIYRDLFGTYKPNTEYIHFTKEQAEQMDRLVPYFWITDQPFARVVRHPNEPDPMYFFNPVVRISATFEQEVPTTVYYGNHVSASDCLKKPSLTLDGRLLNPDQSNIVGESHFHKLQSGKISLMNFGDDINKFFTVALINLDSLHEDSANLHWLITNISTSDNAGISSYEEICDYLPVHGIKGFGHSRYVFLVFQHDAKLHSAGMRINSFLLEDRKFDTKRFIEFNKIVPVGLSWFQTTWDITSNSILHDYMKIKSPVYDFVQQKPEMREEKAYPGRVPFNIYLDYFRTEKSINEQVFLERLKSLDPFDYERQFDQPKVPATIHEEKGPDWMKNVWLKKKNKIGYWRGLRPASVSASLDDEPLRPAAPSKKVPPEYHNRYEFVLRKSSLHPLPEDQSLTGDFDQKHVEAEVEKVIQRVNNSTVIRRSTTVRDKPKDNS